jgi:hypothetical protein
VKEVYFHEDVVGQPVLKPIPANMVGPEGEDLSAWLGGTHQFEYVPSTGMVTLIGEGAWIGLVKTGTDGEVAVPQNIVEFEIIIEEFDGYDLMQVIFDYGWGFGISPTPPTPILPLSLKWFHSL